MISALVKPVWQVARKPYILLPAILLGAVLYFFMDQLFLSFLEVLYRIAVLNEFPDASAMEIPIHLAGKYSTNIISLIALGAVLNACTALATFFYTRYAKKGDAGESLSYALGRIVDAVSFSVFLVIAVIICLSLAIFAFLLLSLGGIFDLAAMAAIIALSLLAVYITIKMSFLLTVMAADNIKLKAAFKKAWQWSAKRFWGVFAVLAVVLIIGNAIAAIGMGIIAGIEDDLVSLAVFSLFSSLGSAYAALAMANYYNSRAENSLLKNTG